MTSRLERLGLIDRIILVAQIVTMSVSMTAQTAAASTALPQSEGNKTALVFEIKDLTSIKIPFNYFSERDEKVKSDEMARENEKIFKANAAILADYLNQKKSPLAPHAEEILKNKNWKLVLAISNGESTLCKNQRFNNCWGVGGAWNLRRYSSFTAGFSDVNRLLEEKYINKGLDTPEKMVNRYVGHPNKNWVYAVNQILNQLNTLPMQS